MRLSAFLIPALLASAAACVDEPSRDREVGDPGIAPAAAIRLDRGRDVYGAFERSVTWPRDTLTVCWMPSAWTAEFASRRLAVQQAVDREWGASGRLRFVWNFNDPCTSTPTADIRIAHDPEDTGWSQIGTLATAVPAGQPTMILDLAGPPPGGCLQLPGTGGGSGSGGGPVIARCDGVDAHSGPPPSVDVWVIATALHEFGHALGLRHEHARPDSTCIVSNETLDFNDGNRLYDGEALWPFDPGSIMSYCGVGPISYGTDEPHISVGDLRALHTLYPGVVALFRDGELHGTATRLGPGYYTTATVPALASVSSFVVPPGFTAVACFSNNQCWPYTASVRALPLELNDRMTDLRISAVMSVHCDPGYLGVSQRLGPGTYRASTGGLGPVGNDAISSEWLPPTTAATLCTEDDGSGGCIYLAGGLFGTSGYAMNPAIDNQVSSVSVQARVVTYSDAQFRGESWSLGLGTYQVSRGATWLTAVRAIANPGLKVSACTLEGSYSPLFGATCAGTCTLLQSSGAIPANTRCLKITTPPIVAQ